MDNKRKLKAAIKRLQKAQIKMMETTSSATIYTRYYPESGWMSADFSVYSDKCEKVFADDTNSTKAEDFEALAERVEAFVEQYTK